MKRIWVYLLGALTGIVLTIITLLIIGAVAQKKGSPTNGLTFFEEPGEVIETSSVKVFQALDDGFALAHSRERTMSDILDDYGLYGDPVVLLYNEEGTPYYDGQIVNPPAGECFRHVGIYRYSARMGNKTVPIVMLLEK